MHDSLFAPKTESNRTRGRKASWTRRRKINGRTLVSGATREGDTRNPGARAFYYQDRGVGVEIVRRRPVGKEFSRVPII
jgi:hypothetical protein